MPTYTFKGYPASVTHRFTCPCCGKPNRFRTFTVEHTVNPFNRNPDGTVKTASQVQRDAAEDVKKERADFVKEPLCASCEKKLPWSDRRALHERRRA